MQKVRCRNCGALHDVPDYHGPMHIVCKACEWHETIPPRRHLPTTGNKLAGAAFAARQQLVSQLHDDLAAVSDLPRRAFETLCTRLLSLAGHEAQRAESGRDDSHAYELRRGNETTYLACAAGRAHMVDRTDVENLVGAMRHDGVTAGIFVTAGSFASDSLEVAHAAGVELIDGAALHERLVTLDPEQLAGILGTELVPPSGPAPDVERSSTSEPAFELEPES